jgi:hypothetical protein
MDLYKIGDKTEKLVDVTNISKFVFVATVVG